MKNYFSVGLYYHKKHRSKDCETVLHAAEQTEKGPEEHEQTLLTQKSFAHLYLRWAPGIGQKPRFGHIIVDFAPFQRFTVFVEKIISDWGNPFKGRGRMFFKRGLSAQAVRILIIPERPLRT